MIPFPSTNSWAMNPAAASIARRPFWSSLVCMRRNSSGSVGLRPRGSKPMSPGVYPSRSNPGWSKGTFSGSTHPMVARFCSAAPMAMVRANQNPVGTWERWVIAGPETWASNKKDDPSTASPTRNPTAASMATRPWVSSASRYRRRVLSSALAANPRGSQNPTGSRAPTRVSMTGTGLAATGAAAFFPKGEKAAADPAKARMAVVATNFILVYLILLLLFSSCSD
mmetsp:Transcript_23168/g.64221  ORF Transcript_23168/g.64221 Transcript_23168/m.64221 type:complete len:225 (+) Transcript_23168:329-1003(+)